MLSQIEVNGFKSLLNFRLKIRPGLNVLIGPNGSGKTNLISFLEFVNNFVRRDLPSAISAAGGSNYIFSQELSHRRGTSLTFTLKGACRYQSYKRAPIDTPDGYFAYRYHAKILLSSVTSLSMQDEEIQLSPLFDTEKEAESYGAGPHLLIQAPGAYSDGTFHREARITIIPPVSGRPIPHEGDARAESLAGTIRSELSGQPHQSIFRTYLSYSFDALENVSGDIACGSNLNIDPTAAKQPDDLADTPGIKKNGAGVAVTLHALRGIRDRAATPQRFFPLISRMRGAKPDTYDRIVSLLRHMDNGITDIRIDTNLGLGKYIAFAVYGDREFRLPLSSISDGTAKWLSATAACLTEADVLAIEEPENFLHPAMQRDLLQVFRAYARTNRHKFAFLTTHSETILNACEPEEILLARYYDSRTVVRGIKNLDQLINEINETGFGVGHYYASDAIS